MNISDLRNRTENQLIEYATRMRKERDEAMRDGLRLVTRIRGLEETLADVREWATRGVADGECFDGSGRALENLLAIIERAETQGETTEERS